MRISPHKHRVSAVLARRFPLEFCRRGFFYVLRASPRKHRVCRAVLAPPFPLEFCTRVFMFCVLRLANTGYVQCFSLGPFWVCTLVFVTFCLTNIGFVQCFSVGSLLIKFVRLCFSRFVMRIFPHKHRVCAVPFPRPPVRFVRLSLSCYVKNISFVQCFSLGSLKVYTVILVMFCQNGQICFCIS